MEKKRKNKKIGGTREGREEKKKISRGRHPIDTRSAPPRVDYSAPDIYFPFFPRFPQTSAFLG